MSGWWGFDLDGTIAHYEDWGDGSIGAPVTPMIRRMKHYLKQGRNVQIVTARIHPDNQDAGLQYLRIRDWLFAQFGEIGDTIPIRCDKDLHMITLFDDRCTQVIPNTGITVQEELRRAVEALNKIAYGNNVHGDYFVAQQALASLASWSHTLVK